MENTGVIETHGLTKRFGNRVLAVDSLAMSVRHGEVAAGAAARPDDMVFCGRWPDQPIDGSYIGLQLKQAAQVARPGAETPAASSKCERADRPGIRRLDSASTVGT